MNVLKAFLTGTGIVVWLGLCGLSIINVEVHTTKLRMSSTAGVFPVFSFTHDTRSEAQRERDQFEHTARERLDHSCQQEMRNYDRRVAKKDSTVSRTHQRPVSNSRLHGSVRYPSHEAGGDLRSIHRSGGDLPGMDWATGLAYNSFV